MVATVAAPQLQRLSMCLVGMHLFLTAEVCLVYSRTAQTTFWKASHGSGKASQRSRVSLPAGKPQDPPLAPIQDLVSLWVQKTRIFNRLSLAAVEVLRYSGGKVIKNHLVSERNHVREKAFSIASSSRWFPWGFLNARPITV